MNYGHYYSLNTHFSDLTNGIAVFDYRGIDVQSKNGKHHIYVTIQECGIHFAYHFYKEYRMTEHIDCDIVTLPFPTNTLEQNHLSELLDECHDVVFPKVIGEYIPLNIINGYSSIDELYPEETKRTGNIVCKMILDFLFDLEHSEIFQVSPLFGCVKSAIRENPLFAALLAKAEYLYQRKVQTNLKSLLQGNSSAKVVYADDYTMAEKRWVEVLNSPNIDRILAESPWFRNNGKNSSVPEELNKVYESKSNSLSAADYLYSIKSRKESTIINNLRYRVKQTAKASARAYMHRYHLTGIFHIWYGNSSWLAASLTIAALGYMLYGFYINAEKMVSAGTRPINLFFSFLAVIVIWILTLLIGKRHQLRHIGILDVVFPRMFAAIVAAWFTIYQYFDNYIGGHVSIGVNIVMFALLIMYVYYEIRKKNQYLNFRYVLVRTLPLIAVAFIHSFLTGWAMLNAIENEKYIYNNVSREQMLMFTTIAVFIGVFIQMLFDNNNKSIIES